MSTVANAAAVVAANHALNVQAMKMATLRQEHAAAESIANMLEEAVKPTAAADASKTVNVEV